MHRSMRILITLSLLVIGCSSDGPSGMTGPDDETNGDDRKAQIEVVAGDAQEGRQYQPLSEEIRVRVTDADGDPLQDSRLTARIEEGDASFPLDEGQAESITLTTDSGGEASFMLVLGEDLNHAVSVRLEDDSDVSATATAVARFAYRRPVDASDGWPVADLDESSVDFDRFVDGIEAVRRGSYPELHSLLIVQDDSLRFESYWPGTDSQGRFMDWSRTTPHEGQSATKSFRSALIGIAIDQGHIASVDQRIEGFFPDHASHFDDTKSRITVGDLLTMSSGLEWDETGAAAGNTDNTLSRMYTLPVSERTEYVLSRPAAFEPGTVFVYNTGASIMLADLVQRASNSVFADFVRTHMKEPMEMTRMPGIGYFTGSGLLPRDMARLGQVYLRRGLWKQTRIVSESFVEESFEEWFEPSAGIGYGYQWWMRTLTTDTGSYRVRYASGNGGQFIIVIDELDAVIVSTGGNFGLSRMQQIFPLVEFHVLPLLEDAVGL